MLRVVLTLHLFFLTLFACEGGFSSCVQKVKDSKAISKNIVKLPISESQSLVFSRTKPRGKILKYDPHLSLYLVQDNNNFPYPFKINMRYPSGVALVNNVTSKESKFTIRQIGLNNFAKLRHKMKFPAVITNSCCSLEGIVTPQGIIEKEYIQRFLQTKDLRYSDIGIRVNDTKKGVLVSSFDPFFKNNQFKKGDQVVSFDGAKIDNSATLMRKILFSKIGSIHQVQIKRNGKIMTIRVKTQQRLSGGYKVETYLEKYGITFDKHLRVLAINKKKKSYGLLKGDKLLKVNGKLVTTQNDVMQNISNFKDFPILLFERNDNFQFFVKLN